MNKLSTVIDLRIGKDELDVDQMKLKKRLVENGR